MSGYCLLSCIRAEADAGVSEIGCAFGGGAYVHTDGTTPAQQGLYEEARRVVRWIKLSTSKRRKQGSHC
jgi:hypothetical protein